MLFFLVLAHAIAVLLFGCGFFPQKKVLDGHAELDQVNQQPVFDKLVIVVIDALRSDFLFDESISKFDFVHEKLNEGAAWGFTAYSNPPTVTLPRLKGITTGSTPNFLDAILNVAEDDTSSSLASQDSWLWQFRHNGNKRIRFFGDDTWLKLFPNDTLTGESMFDEFEGTNSFFVSDFTQVDLNVTRHIDKQLKEKRDWDVLILHYLGLDHIGHKDGPYSQFMAPKHREMDGIIRNLYKKLNMDKTLMVVMGDHGMNDLGNHGGSSAGETSAGLVFLSNKLKKFDAPIEQAKHKRLPIKSPETKEDNEEKTFNFLTKIQQIDIVPTLSAMFGLPIPKNSVGVIIPELLRLFGKLNVKKNIVQQNWNQLFNLAKDNSLQDSFDVSKETDIDRVIETMRDLQGEIAKTATNYNYPLLVGSYVAALVITLIVYYKFFKAQEIHILDFRAILLLTISLIMGISVFGSSFIEEEHQFWWWILTGLIMLSMVHLRFQNWGAHAIIFLCLRVIRGWNNSGQKYTYENVISSILKTNTDSQWYLNLLTTVFVGFNMKKGIFQNESEFFSGMFEFVSSFLLSMLFFSYKVNWTIVNGENVPQIFMELVLQTNRILLKTDANISDEEVLKEGLIPMARLFFNIFSTVMVCKLALMKFSKNKNIAKDFSEISRYITIFLMFQTSTYNIGSFFFFEIANELLAYLMEKHYNNDALLGVIVSIPLQYFTFFQNGGTNSIATVDLSNAYNGVSENYNIYVVGALMCISNFAPTIYWSMFSWRITYAGKKTIKDKFSLFVKTKYPFLVFQATVGVCLLLACIILRYHLFIWSVFSPKLCYYLVWTLFIGGIVNTIPELLVLLFV